LVKKPKIFSFCSVGLSWGEYIIINNKNENVVVFCEIKAMKNSRDFNLVYEQSFDHSFLF
jgi:hypothetical protein